MIHSYKQQILYSILKYLILFFFLIASNSIFADTIHVFTQAQFDKAVQDVNAGNEMDIKLSPGIYILKEQIITKKSLSITGVDSSITWNNDTYSITEAISETKTHYVCKIKHAINPFSLFVDESDRIINVSESVDPITLVNNSHQEVVIDSVSAKVFNVKIPITKNLSHLRNKKFSNVYGYLDCAWSTVDFYVTRSDDNYFYCTTLNASKIKNLNYDLVVYKKYNRYVLYNAEIKLGSIYFDKEKIYIPKEVNKIYCLNYEKFHKDIYSIKTSSNLTLKGITFKNFYGISINSKIKEYCNIYNCTFLNTLGPAFYLYKANDNNSIPVNISGCKFYRCSLFTDYSVLLLSLFKNNKCINFNNCIISRYPNNLVNYKNCMGSLYVYADALISNNTIFNAPRDLLFITRGCVTVTGNVLYNSNEFNSFVDRNLSGDFGLIYCGYVFSKPEDALTNELHKIIIDGNLIYGAQSFGNDARGIMIDDGRGDVICRNNIIFNTGSTSILSWNAKSFISTSGVRNLIENNILGLRYSLECGSGVPDKYLAISNNNYLLGDYKNILGRIKIKQKDTNIRLQSIFSVDNGKIIISKSDYKILKKLKNWKKIKQFFYVNN